MKNKEVMIGMLVCVLLVTAPLLLSIYYFPIPEYRRELTIRNSQDAVLENFHVQVFNISKVCGDCINLTVVMNNKTCKAGIYENTLGINLDLEQGNNSGYINFQKKKYLLRGRGRNG